MTTLVWDQPGERVIEGGVSKGVLYTYEGVGIPWNGLISIEEQATDEVEPIHFDGVKFNDLVTIGDYVATLKAFTYPEEFQECQGILKDETGFYVTQQRPNRFGLSYQTNVGDDLHPVQTGYKIHVVYNLTAVPANINYQTLAMEVDPIEFEWTISGLPEEVDYFMPTAHVIFDTRQMDPYLLQDLEDILYGGEDGEAHLPPLQGLATFIRKWGRLIITEFADGSWEAYTPLDGVITMLDDTTFQIVSDTAVYLDADTYEISSSEKNEEDV